MTQQTVHSPRRTAALAGLVGALVIGLVVFLATRPRWEATSVYWWSATPADALALSLGVAVPPGMDAKDTRVRVQETPQTVQVAALHAPAVGSRTTDASQWIVTVQVQLKSPLNGRQVVDRNGDPIREKPSP